MSQRNPNPVRGRVIMEITPNHAILYLCDKLGYVIDQEVFRYPLTMSTEECSEECRDLFNVLYDAIDCAVNPELQAPPPRRPESG